jgi:hypothetical protein
MSPDQGGHTSMPVFGLTPASYAGFAEFKTRDIVLLASESTANLCNEAPHWSFIVDVTVENSKSTIADSSTRPTATGSGSTFSSCRGCRRRSASARVSGSGHGSHN